jgi:hypothetical protein
MDPDELKGAWQAQATPGPLRVDAGLLREELRRRQRAFAATIFWRDVREVGVCLLLIPVWIYLGIDRSFHWTWYLMVPALVWIASYLLADRLRAGRRQPEPSEPLRRHVEASLEQLNRQIRLLRTVFWWYLLPIALAKLAFVGHDAWDGRSGGWWMLLAMSEVLGLGVLVIAGVYWLNQYVVRTDLEPRRRELEAMLTSLEDERPDPGR